MVYYGKKKSQRFGNSYVFGWSTLLLSKKFSGEKTNNNNNNGQVKLI